MTVNDWLLIGSLTGLALYALYVCVSALIQTLTDYDEDQKP